MDRIGNQIPSQSVILPYFETHGQTAINNGTNLDVMISTGEVLDTVAQSITVNIVARTMATPTEYNH